MVFLLQTLASTFARKSPKEVKDIFQNWVKEVAVTEGHLSEEEADDEEEEEEYE